jgi:beta-glucosidase
MACVKHYAANSIENSRWWVDVTIDERTLRDVYLPHFRDCVDAGAACVMSAYNKMNGTFCGHHRHLLTDILKDEWGFDGFVMSDFLFGVRDARAAMDGGQDMEMPYRFRFKALPRLVRSGRVPAARIDASVRRLLRQQVRFARIGEPERYRPDAVACDAHRALAREAAERAIVLLRNEPVAPVAAARLAAKPAAREIAASGALAGSDSASDSSSDATPVLPLPPDPSLRIALFGKLARRPAIGDHGSSQVYPPAVATIDDGLQRLAGEVGWRVADVSALGAAHATGAAQLADVCIVVAGATHRDEGEFMITHGGDRGSLRLRAADEALIETVVAANPRTVVVLIGGSAFIIERWRRRVPAIVMAWYPGMEGGHAVARVLAGLVNPSGRLPMTWPRDDDQLPPFARWTRHVTYGPLHGYRLAEADGHEPAFWFGFGLSYTTFALGEAVVEPDGEALTVRVPVRNTGARAGATVVQLYAAERLGSDVEPRRTLCAFARVELAAGAADDVALALSAETVRTMRVHAEGELRLWTGTSADPVGHQPIAGC